MNDIIKKKKNRNWYNDDSNKNEKGNRKTPHCSSDITGTESRRVQIAEWRYSGRSP